MSKGLFGHRLVGLGVAALCFGAGAVLADGNIALHDLSGTWRGEATFLLPEGSTDQIHAFTFKSLGNGFYAGEHSWDIRRRNSASTPTRSSLSGFQALAHEANSWWTRIQR